MISLVKACNTMEQRKEIQNNPQLEISGLTVRATTKNKSAEARKRFARYLRNNKK